LILYISIAEFRIAKDDLMKAKYTKFEEQTKNKNGQSVRQINKIAQIHKQERWLYSPAPKGGETMQIYLGGFSKSFEGFLIRARAIV